MIRMYITRTMNHLHAFQNLTNSIHIRQDHVIGFFGGALIELTLFMCSDSMDICRHLNDRKFRYRKETNAIYVVQFSFFFRLEKHKTAIKCKQQMSRV